MKSIQQQALTKVYLGITLLLIVHLVTLILPFIQQGLEQVNQFLMEVVWACKQEIRMLFSTSFKL